jgi:hypothetical protein
MISMRRKEQKAIPLCRSEFLQDVTIALGRRSLKSVRYQGTLDFELVEEDTNAGSSERLNIETRRLGSLTRISIWADGSSWIYVKNSVIFEMYANLAGMEIYKVAELLHASLRDVDSVKQIWEQHTMPNH